jgi:UDP-N-acetylmuramate-alanine ligase
VSPDALLESLGKQQREVILTMGAGNIDSLVEPIEKLVLNYV